LVRLKLMAAMEAKEGAGGHGFIARRATKRGLDRRGCDGDGNWRRRRRIIRRVNFLLELFDAAAEVLAGIRQLARAKYHNQDGQKDEKVERVTEKVFDHWFSSNLAGGAAVFCYPILPRAGLEPQINGRRRTAVTKSVNSETHFGGPGARHTRVTALVKVWASKAPW